MTIETTMQGQRVRLLWSSVENGVLLDTWEHLDRAPGSWLRIGYVGTFPVGQDWEFGSMPDGPTTTAYDDHPSRDPLERLRSALWQERARAKKRLTGGQFQQIYPGD